MKSSVQLNNMIVEATEALARDAEVFNSAEGDERAAAHDRIVATKARVAVYQEQLTDALEAEDALRRAGDAPKAAEHASCPVRDVATAFTGSRNEFLAAQNGAIGRTVKLSASELLNATDPTYKLTLPTKTDYTLPSNVIELPMGFIDTLATGTTDFSLEYMVAGEFTNNADLWKPGKVKPQSNESWEKDNALLFTVAHHMPISKQTAYHYGQLQSVIANDLMAGLKIKEAACALNLDDGDGRKGVLKKDIQKYQAKKSEKFYDSVRRMITESWLKTGIRPDYIAVHPYVLTELDLAKSTDGWYMVLMMNNRLWQLPVVEDVNLESEVSGSSGKEKVYGALVYNHTAATWYTSEADALTIGLVNDQFIRNEYTLLAEGEHLITVTRPKSFVYLADAIKPGA
ncbi:phage major capsid protein [Collinsella sp. AGMB00827]|uniref:Phage major capsid protein n=1 Tax=Collinsella ureilytica TaxID=2869515 RepID=A0ABS7MHF5_9ACTN|nr:phage major capsid protein [Collinsella urealyticum]MBY4796788.1 phage major capsid protein [Collinsella urealyticum]